MIRITFHEKVKESAADTGRIAACDDAGKIRYVLNDGKYFENRSCVLDNGTFHFDGYSTWFEETGETWRPDGDFTVSFSLAPQEYSDEGDGIYYQFDEAERKGFYILLRKEGRTEVGFGNGRDIFSFSSIRSHMKKYAWNILTIVFRKEAGWCDLYINGIFSNRKQFPRHMALAWPRWGAVIGKKFSGENLAYKHEAFYTSDFEWMDTTGVFCGLMNGVFFRNGCMTDAEVREFARSFPCGQEAEPLTLDRSIYKNDVQRPQFHMIAPGKWMNEPHAPLWYQGNYHIFYQANPHAPSWNHIQWGHMISPDMVHWRDLPLALETEEDGPDPDGCWSGSSLLDKDGIPRIYYTAGNNRKFPNQAVALAVPVPGDPELKKWTKHEQPVQEQTEGWLGEFRDPFVWLEQGTYYMLVGTGDENNGGGNAVLYSSEDGIKWTSHGFILDYDYEKNQGVGHVWELPVLLPLRDETGEVCCHILLLCACQIENDIVETYYFLGNWDCEKKTFRKFHDRAMLLDLGNGTYTGPSGFVTPDKRSVMFSIAQGKRAHKDNIRAGWAHNGGLPVELFVRDHALCTRPIREILDLRKKKLLELEHVTAREANRYLETFSGNRLFLEFRTDQEISGVETYCDGQKVKVSYDRTGKRFSAEDENGAVLSKYRGQEDDVTIDEQTKEIRWEYFLDHSMIEVNLNDRKLMTLRNYIDGTSRKLRLPETEGRLTHLVLWEMDAAYELREHLPEES